MVQFLLLMGCSGVGYTLSMKNSYQLTVESMEASLKQINTDTGRILLSVQNRAVEVSEDIDLQIALRKRLPETEREIYKERLNFDNKLYYESIRVENIDGLYVIGANGALFHATYNMRKQNFLEDEWYKQVMETGEILWIAPHNGSLLGRNLDFETISIVVPIQDKASTRRLGVVVADILVENLGQIKNSDIVYNGSICILDKDNKVIHLNNNQEEQSKYAMLNKQNINEALAGVEKIENEKFLTISGTRYFVKAMGIPDSKWKLMCLIPANEVFLQVHILRNILIGVGLLLMIFGILFSVHASVGIVKPIRAIQMKMLEMEKGDFTVYVKEGGTQEVEDLARGFNHMVQKVNELMQNEHEIQEKLKQADFNALQAQINPHFLYNTLDSINWMARMNQVDKVEEMIDSLTSFLRIGLSRGRVFITLREELKHVESYISIQKLRYQKLLDYSINVPEKLYDYKMIKMILQPLVENAIYHGIKEKDAHGTILITGYENGDQLILCVEDDGLGMTKSRLKEVQEMMKNGIAQNKDAYGILNVQRRIWSYFGKEYGLEYMSEYTKGTKVTITLPKQEVIEENV